MTYLKQPPAPERVDIQPLGEGALVLTTGSDVTLACQQRLWAIAAEAAQWPHVVDVVPGMNNLTILFDPLVADADGLSDKLRSAWKRTSAIPKNGRQVDIPVIYGGAGGPDLVVVAEHTGFSIAEIIKRHTAADYIVYFLGFQPGFAYMGGLDPLLATPRRSEPRLIVPAGSVGIGGSQTAVYPAASPGGWQLIGHTAVRLFDPLASPPTLLQPGDRVRFVAAEVLS